MGTFLCFSAKSFLKKSKTKSRYTDIKNRRELCSRFKMMFHVTALKFKDGTVVAPIHSLTVPKRIEWWMTVFSLSIPPALGGFATSQSFIYSVVVPLSRNFIMHDRTYVCQVFFSGQFREKFFIFNAIDCISCGRRSYHGRYIILYFCSHHPQRTPLAVLHPYRQNHLMQLLSL